MEELKTRFPAGLDYAIVYDTTPFIEQSVDEVFHALFDAVILVAIVVLAIGIPFLRMAENFERERLKAESDATTVHRLIAEWEPLKSVA